MGLFRRTADPKTKTQSAQLEDVQARVARVMVGLRSSLDDLGAIVVTLNDMNDEAQEGQT